MIEEIERRRRAAKISQKALCDAASVNPNTYSALKTNRRGGQVKTLAKLSAALDQLTQQEARNAD